MDQDKLIVLLRSAERATVRWLQDNVLIMDNALQLVVVLSAVLCARILEPGIGEFIRSRSGAATGFAIARSFLRQLATLTLPVVALLFLWLSIAIAAQVGWPRHILQIVASLTSAWVVIRLASTLIRDPGWARVVSVSAWSIAALGTLGLFDDALALLESLGITLGGTRVTVLMVVKGVISLAILLWVAMAASGIFETRINRSTTLTPSVQVLLGKLVKVVLVTIAFVVALNIVGADLTAFAVFGGALGVGIGFGLQKIISNLVSGIILLLDKSIKPGDVITVGNTVGWIESLGARYTSVRTDDGIEHLIPNEDLIVNRVENWSHSDKAVRLKIPIGVSYDTDLRLAVAQCVAAAADVKRVLKQPEIRCLLKGFGDSSVDLELRVWIDDPSSGRAVVISEILLNVWDRFHEHGIEIPFPQRDLHLKSWEPGRVSLPGASAA